MAALATKWPQRETARLIWLKDASLPTPDLVITSDCCGQTAHFVEPNSRWPRHPIASFSKGAPKALQAMRSLPETLGPLPRCATQPPHLSDVSPGSNQEKRKSASPGKTVVSRPSKGPTPNPRSLNQNSVPNSPGVVFVT